MTNRDTELRLQAFLDDELSPREAGVMAQRLQHDSAARSLAGELKRTKDLLAGNELDFRLPESREFFWSKIERAILSSPDPAPAATPARPWWLRWTAPAAGAALAAVLVFASVKLLGPSEPDIDLAALNEMETPLSEASLISFHSQAAGITVVWVKTH